MRARQGRQAGRLALAFLLAALALAESGCASTAVIRADDATFTAAQARLAKTEAIVDRAKVTPAERTLFMQAESVYRYRVEPVPHSWPRYAFGGLMTLTDFTPLQSLANAPDVVDVRDHSADAATQLWEAFMTRYPDSALAPMVLYRLGWSYRSAVVSGFPRSSPMAFDEVSDVAPNSRLAALAREAKGTEWKSRGAVLGRSLVPGLAHFYVEDYKGGWIRLGVAALAVAAITASTQNDGWRFGSITEGLVGFAVLSLDYADSFEDANLKLVRYNERKEHEFEEKYPDAP